MAYPVNTKAARGSSGSITIPLPAHQDDDVVFIFVSGRNTGTHTGPGGSWQSLGSLSNSGVTPNSCWYQRVTTAPLSDPTVTYSGTGFNMGGLAVVVRGADVSTATSAIDDWDEGTGSGFSVTSPTMTLSDSNELIIAFTSGERTTEDPFFAAGEVIDLDYVADGASTSHFVLGCGYTYDQNSPSDQYTVYASNAGTSQMGIFTIAVKDNGDGDVMGYSETGSAADLVVINLGDHAADVSGQVDISDVSFTPQITSITNSESGVSQTVNSDNFAGDGPTHKLFPNALGVGITANNPESGDIIVNTLELNSTVDLSSSKLVFSGSMSDNSLDSLDDLGRVIGFGDDTNASIFLYDGINASVKTTLGIQTFLIDTAATGYEIDTAGAGSLDWTAVKHFMHGVKPSAYGGNSTYFGPIYKTNPMKMLGGSSAFPCSFNDSAKVAIAGALNTVSNQSGQTKGQFFSLQDIQIGNGSDDVYWKSEYQAIEFPQAYNYENGIVQTQLDAASLTLSINVTSGSTVDLSITTVDMGNFHNFEVDASTSVSATYSFASCNILNATATIQAIGLDTYEGVSFIGCKELTINGFTDRTTKTLGASTISNCVDTYAVTVTDRDEFEALKSAAFSNNNYSIRITGNHGGETWSMAGMTVADGTGTYDIQYTGTGTLTLEADAGSGWSQGRAEATVGTLTISTPTVTLTINSDVAASDIKIFDTGTQTIEAQATGTTASTTAAGTYDVTVMKAGYLPQRQTGVVLGTSSVAVEFALVADPVYDSGHGLTYTTDYSYNRSTKELTLTTRQEGRNFYSALIDDFIAQSSLDNTQFNFKAVGPDSIFFLEDAEIIDSSSEDNWKGAGIRYLDSSDVVTAEWCSVKSAGTIPGGGQGEYQQVNGSGTTDLRATGAVDQIIQVYGDDTHGDFDYRDHLVIKYQLNGYGEVRRDVLALAGISALEPFEYSIAAEPVAITASTGDPAITLTITDHGASPVTWNSKDFSITVQYSGADSGEDIIRELNYNLSLDTTYQGKDPFNWPEMVIEAGSDYETLRGITEGGTGASLKGIRVVNGSGDPHPDFTRFQADDGTYYTVPVTANGSITGIVSGSRLRIYNETTATETYNDVPGTSYAVSYTDGTTYSSGDVVKIYVTQTSGTTAQLPFSTTTVASSTGWTALVEQESDTVYDSYGLNGSAITKFTADYVNDEVDLIVSSNFSAAEFYAWWCYNLTTSQGISDFFGGITAQDAANLRINNDVISMYLDNTTTTNVYQTDNIRIYRTDQAYPVKNPTSGGGGIDVVWRDRVYIAETGVSGLTASESTQLFAASTFNPAVDVVEGSETWQESMRLVRAEAAGKVAVSGNTVTFRDAADSTDRIVATVDEQGQRTAITTDVS